MRETEYKFLVTKEKFHEILNHIEKRYPDSPPREHVQINYYYDTFDRYLLSNNSTLRVRQIENELALELKEAVSNANDYSTCTETRQEITTLPPEITLNEGKYAWIPFRFQGNLITQRISIKPSETLSIDFDINCFLGSCDHEIEMEFISGAQDEAAVLIDELGLMQYKNTLGGKAKRFFEYKANLFKE